MDARRPSPSAPRKRFRPSAVALQGTRAYQRPDPTRQQPAPVLARSSERKRKWSTEKNSRGGRFIRRHSGGRIATYGSECTLMHIVTSFAIGVARAAAAEAADRTGSSGVVTEEGDVRKALTRLMQMAPAITQTKAATGKSKASPMCAAFLES